MDRDEQGAMAGDRLQQADRLRDLRMWDAAILAYRAHLAAEPSDWRAQVQLGHCLKESGDPAEALVAYRAAEALAPGHADIHLQIGHALKLTGDAAQAWRAYARALEIDPTHEEAAREASALAQFAAPVTRGERVPGQTLQVVFDTSDLVAYLADNRTPTGIQRVQLNVTARALLDPIEGVATAAVAFDPAGGTWREIGRDLFLTLWRLSRSGGDPRAADWQEALVALRKALTTGPDFAFAPGARLVNLGTSWWIKDYFLHVRHVARVYGVRYVPMIHDCIPLMTPEHCAPGLVEEFAQWFSGMVAMSDQAIANSEWSAGDARRIAGAALPGLPFDVAVMRLDADLKRDLGASAADAWPARPDLPEQGEPFVLCVGTIESRKNHLMLFNAWLALIRKHGAARVPRLVCIGKAGWLADAAMTLWKNSPALQDRVSIAHGIPDTVLATLYRHALFTVTNSHYEGWGLPVTESLSFGKVPVVARNTSLVEAGGEAAVYFEPGSEPDLGARLEQMIFDTEERTRREAALAATTRLRSWSEIADQMMREAARGGEAPTGPRLTVEAGTTHALRLIGGGQPSRAKAVADMLRDGLNWYPLEPWGVWTRPGVARLRLALPAGAADGPLRLYLGCVAPGQEAKVGLRAYGAGTTPPPFRRFAVEPATRFTCLADVASPAAEVIVEIDGGVGSGIGTRRKPDTRKVGLGVTSVMVCRPNDLVARLDFLERHAFRVLGDA
ncbi:glycosyltransferase family 4 protein [Neoroseomonas oryzicola]|uniref:Glycosyltransferase n=1 Tax=Neoroseomonas oryzicola TaxID=535904 RepID=A0A9X9WEV1_9PROT|nr:glycosyltransferase [Neoroseomonas oryzicola]MBR0658861.1 glycosyltransferase [Neoroseomonas oryzicola]NKE15787.1 glycosyltransferase [Neoroseomonas oryzicola]